MDPSKIIHHQSDGGAPGFQMTPFRVLLGEASAYGTTAGGTTAG